MSHFDNQFYLDGDCNTIHKSANNKWYYKQFDRAITSNPNAFRTPFQLDLDNLTFCGAFRRLQGKTQVRQVGPKCFSRTRLSHSIEIARIAQSIVSKVHIKEGRSFIDSDLVEFACFAHDIGNPPFGHAGERELNHQMQKYGGFEGNAQSLRIVTETAWVKLGIGPTKAVGIGPTKAAVESILKYKDFWATKQNLPEDQQRHFLYDYQEKLLALLKIGRDPSIECQIMNLADDIGNALIDFSDGARAGIMTPQKVKDWLDSQSDRTGKFAAEDVLEAFRDNIVVDKFTPKRIRDCINSIVCSLHKKRRDYKISLSPQYQNFIRSLQSMSKAFLFTDRKIQVSDDQGAFII